MVHVTAAPALVGVVVGGVVARAAGREEINNHARLEMELFKEFSIAR